MVLKRFRYFALIFGLFLYIGNHSSAQNSVKNDKEVLSFLLKQLYNIDSEPSPIEKFKNKEIFLFMTKRTCIRCYSELEIYFKKEYPNYHVNIIVFLPENPLLIESRINLINTHYKGDYSIHFLYQQLNDSSERPLVEKYSSEPSPYFFIVDDNQKVTFYNVSSTEK